MSNGFKDSSGKFHPISTGKGVRKSRDQKAKQHGVKLRKKKEPFPVEKSKGATQQDLVQMQRADVGRRKLDVQMSDAKRLEWENVVGSEIVKVKHEMIDGKPVTTIRFANGEEWFEFDKISHQDEFMKDNDLHKHEGEDGEFVEVDHPMIAGFVTMASGKVLFGERESKMKNDGIRLKRGEFKVGDIVMVSPDNDNDGYDSFRGKKLRITHVEDDESFYDEAMEDQGLYSFETLDGEEIGSSLYDYELVKA